MQPASTMVVNEVLTGLLQLDFAEDIPIRYRVGENENNALINCGGRRNDIA